MGAILTRANGPVDDAAIVAAFDRECVRPSRWSNTAGDTYAEHSHTYHKVLYCLRGSITFQLIASGEAIRMRPGDRIDIAPNTAHAAVVGSEGVTCIEAAIPM